MPTYTPHFDCPLCQSNSTSLHEQGRVRSFYRCRTCELVYVPASFHLGASDEKAIYDQHENDPEDPGYRTFLSRLMKPLLNYLPPDAKGLDFGCGPGPALSLMFEELGFDIKLYDPFYARTPDVLTEKYDFITATEVVEHLANPSAVFEQLFSMLKPGGVLGIMTKMIPDDIRICDWHYARDLTHISFYDQKSFNYLADKFHYHLEFIGADVIIMKP